MSGSKAIQLRDKVKHGDKIGTVVLILDGITYIAWTMGSGWTHTPGYNADELTRYSIEYVEEVRTELAQQDYVRELEESA